MMRVSRESRIVTLILVVSVASISALWYSWLRVGRVYAVAFESSQPFDGLPELRKALVYRSGNTVLVRVQDYFHETGSLRQPYLTVAPQGTARLILDVDRDWRLVSKKCEHQRKVEIRFETRYSIATLEVHNANTGENISAEMIRVDAPVVAWTSGDKHVGVC
jgi:hypothetical protein